MVTESCVFTPNSNFKCKYKIMCQSNFHKTWNIIREINSNFFGKKLSVRFRIKNCLKF